MNVNRARKEELINELGDGFASHHTFYLLDFMGIPVSKSMELRSKFREKSHSFRVVKNRLALRALRDEFPEELKDHFKGPTAVAYTSEDSIDLARMIKEFSTENKMLTVKAGLIEGKFLPRDQFNSIASLTSKKDLIAKIGMMMASPLTKLLRTMQAPLNSLDSIFNQLKEKKQGGGNQ